MATTQTVMERWYRICCDDAASDTDCSDWVRVAITECEQNRLGLAKWHDDTLSTVRVVPVSTTAQLLTALSNAQPGDDIQLDAGVYSASNLMAVNTSGTMANWVTVRTNPTAGAQAQIVNSQPRGNGVCLTLNGNYIQVSDIETYATTGAHPLTGSGENGYGTGITSSQFTHHIRVVDGNHHDHNSTGVNLLKSSNFVVAGNIATGNGNWHINQGSNISIYQAADQGQTNDLYGGQFANVIANNLCAYALAFYEPDNGSYSDSNGIIVDDFHNSQGGGGGVYSLNTLIEGNLCHDNGGRGVNVFDSDNVTVLLNTSYRNARNGESADPDRLAAPNLPNGQRVIDIPDQSFFSPASGLGAWDPNMFNYNAELGVNYGGLAGSSDPDDVTFRGNAVHARQIVGSIPAGQNGAGTQIPSPLVSRDRGDAGGTRDYGQNAWTHDVVGGVSGGGVTPRFDPSDVTTGQDTDLEFTNPAAGDFRPLPTSPLVGHSFVAGLSVVGTDLYGQARTDTVGAIELVAC